MKTLTAEEFLKITRENPQWAKTLTRDTTITGKVTLPRNHPLKALSPKLIFQNHADFSRSQISIAEGIFHKGVEFYNSQVQEIGELSVLGTDEDGDAAIFWGCKSLDVARGTFPGFVDFTYSGIQEIAKDLHVTAPNKKGNAANFSTCNRLTVARGIFSGYVNFSGSGIQEIAEDLNITAPDQYGSAANFWICKKLTVARGTFPGFVNFSGSGIQEIAQDIHVTAPDTNGDAARFCGCENLRIASGKFSGTVDFSKTPITHAQNLEITAQEGKTKAIFTELCLRKIPFPIEEIDVPEELRKRLRLKNLHKNLESTLPALPLEL